MLLHSQRKPIKLPKKQTPNSNPKRKTNPALKYSGMATSMAGLAAIGFFGGRWIDNYLNFEKPVFAIALLMLFLSAFMIKLVRDVSQDK